MHLAARLLLACTLACCAGAGGFRPEIESAKPGLPGPGGLWLCHPRPAPGDSAIRLPAMDSLFVNGRLPAGAELWVDGQPVAALPDGRFARQLPWPEDRAWTFRVLRGDSVAEGDLLLLSPPEVREPDAAERRAALFEPPCLLELGERPILSTAPEASYWLFPAPGSRLPAAERQGEWFRLLLGGDLEAWTSLRHVAGASPETLWAETRRFVGPTIRCEEGDEDELGFLFRVDPGPPAWRVEQDPEQGLWRLLLPGTLSRFDLIELPPDGRVRHVDWEPRPGGELELRFQLRPGAFRGHALRWEEPLLRIQFLPLREGLRGRLVLLDPGHGGPREPGCVGAGGIREAELNLLLAEELGRRLERAGARVAYTRLRDRTVGLYDRVDLADSLRPDLFLSLHHNSVAAREDPWGAEGFSVFYYSAWSAPAARALHRELAERLPLRDAGLFWRSLAVCRQWSCPALLLEAGSLIHPREEDRLLDHGFRKRQVRAIVKALRNYFKNPTKP